MATAVWRGQLTFGLLTFPVKLYAAARRETIRFRNMAPRRPAEEEDLPDPLVGKTKATARLAQVPAPIAIVEKSAPPAPSSPPPEPVYTSEDRAVQSGPKKPIVKGYEFEPDRFVAIDPAEIRKLVKATSRDLEVTEFVHWDEIDPVYLDASYFVVPDPSGEKAYSLLCAAMKKTAFAALAQIAMHGREQVLVLRLGGKGLVAHTMFYYSEVRREEEFAASQDTWSAKELDMAAKLIQQLAEPFQPERYIDAYKQRVEALIDEKTSRVAAQPAHAEEAPAARKPPVDILDALKRSLEQVASRKAPQPATTAVPRTKRRSA